MRDRIPEILKEKNIQVEMAPVPDGVLWEKLQEEMLEAIQAKTVENLIEELADILEVLHGIARYKKIPWDSVTIKAQNKRETNGVFEEMHYIEYIDVPLDHPDLGRYVAK